MSDIEHLVENAIFNIKNDKTYEYWKNMWQTKEQLKRVKSSSDEIWEIAMYCYYTYIVR